MTDAWETFKYVMFSDDATLSLDRSIQCFENTVDTFE
jgi:hypothetical protein